MFIRKLISLKAENFKRFITNKMVVISFLKKGYILRKPKHINKRKYIHLGTYGTIDVGARLDCYETKSAKPNLVIGNNFFASFNLTLLCSSNLIIGDDCIFASDVFVSTENHSMDPRVSYLDGNLISKDVNIGNGVWLGEKVIILPGVTIGKKAIIGAGSVVTKNIPPYSIAVGNPAKVVKRWNFEMNMWEKI